MPRESKYADKVSSRDVKQAKIGDTVPIEESENKDRQSGSQESQNFQRRQGNNSSQQQRKQTVYVLGDSMIRNVRRQNINRESRMYYTHLKTFSGARVEEMKHYMEPAIVSEPEGIIIHSGTNNLRNEDPNTVANKIIQTALNAKRRNPCVAVSSLIVRTDSSELEGKRQAVNQLLRKTLRSMDIALIENDNINERHLDRWGLHLNTAGTAILTGNFIQFLNDE